MKSECKMQRDARVSFNLENNFESIYIYSLMATNPIMSNAY